MVTPSHLPSGGEMGATMITLLHSPRRDMEVSFTSRGKKGRGDHGLYPSLLGKWMGCGHSHSISPLEGRRERVAMASDLLFLEGGGVWP